MLLREAMSNTSLLNKIKNGIAFTREYPDWDSLLPDLHRRDVDALIPEIAERYASESVKEYKEKQWVSVKDANPDPGIEVLVWSARYGRTFATYVGTNKHGSMWRYTSDPIVSFKAPTHWQPLPSPPIDSFDKQ
jgi:hypothetical protein